MLQSSSLGLNFSVRQPSREMDGPLLEIFLLNYLIFKSIHPFSESTHLFLLQNKKILQGTLQYSPSTAHTSGRQGKFLSAAFFLCLIGLKHTKMKRSQNKPEVTFCVLLHFSCKCHHQHRFPLSFSPTAISFILVLKATAELK